MKVILSQCLLCVVLLAAATWSHAQKNAGPEKAVADLEQQWLRSQRSSDADLLVPLLADGFTNTSSEGKVTNKAEAIAEAKATKYASADYVDLKVAIFGDTAIAVGTFRGKGTDPSGNSIDSNERFTDTWVKMPNGKWQCVASHQSPIKM